MRLVRFTAPVFLTMTLAGTLAAQADPTRTFPHAEARQQLADGLTEARQLRMTLLENDASRAKALARKAIRLITSSTGGGVDRAALEGFPLTEGPYVTGIRTTNARDAVSALESFKGSWFGLWDTMKVAHDWADVIHEEGLMLQYAWIGDGFGWNIVDGDSAASWILGTVYHVEDGDVTRVRFRRPHVGIAFGSERLAWITRGEVFLEQVRDDRYVITGFNYRWSGEVVEVVGTAFQATYTRDPDNLQPWVQFALD